MCAKSAASIFDTVALVKAGDRSDTRIVHFCSHACWKTKYIGYLFGAFECPDCQEYVLGHEPKSGFRNWYWNTSSACCLACYAAKTLRHGQTLRDIGANENKLSVAHWLRPDILAAAGYKVQKTPNCEIAREVQLKVFIVFQDGCFISIFSKCGPPTVYIRPNGARARAAALLLCAAQRLDRGSLLAVLPRDLVVLLGKRVLVEQFAQEWLYFKNEETEKG